MTSANQQQSTIHLVAPELAGAIETFPNMDFENGLDEIRAGFMDRDMPPLPAGLEHAQVDAYHRRVLAEIGPLLPAADRAWLEASCAPLA